MVSVTTVALNRHNIINAIHTTHKTHATNKYIHSTQKLSYDGASPRPKPILGRFGRIMALKAKQEVLPGEEITVNYGYKVDST